MVNKQSNYDKVILAICAIIALGVAGWLFVLKGGFAETLVVPKVSPKADFGEIPIEEVANAMNNLTKVYNWTSPEKNGKPVPLNKSIPIVVKDGELFDMFTEDKPLRPPMTNKFLRDNELEYTAPNVGALDPDGDGFSNEEEFAKKTNPKDGQSHPPLTDKLYFKERVQNDYNIVMQSPDLPILVQRTAPTKGSVFIDVVPKDFGFDKGAAPRFTAQKFEKKTAPDGKEASELVVEDKTTKQTFTLVYRKPFNLAEYQAKLEFWVGVVTEITVKKGETFRLPNVASTFLLQDVSENSATVVEMKDGKPGEPFVVNPKP